ncbi:uncharacterized protein NEMAJ01_1002 [Nematocida major]|uniref:uncharacterized protein n=1 Tax=Nematocida major TaxID=1912982 RepID=UPI0020074EFA|nr:uncharacterized protein NEMAJ01_1002 [Nematocida major]KAH9386106.1 hypothetical protein NEMAJ01_1002 [Nematocida major]
MELASTKADSYVTQNNNRDRKITSLIVQAVLMGASLAVYVKKGGMISLALSAYFTINSCFLLIMILVSALFSEKSADKNIPPVPKAPELEKVEKKPEEKASTKKLDFNFQLTFRKKNKSIAPPKPILIKKYDDYASDFQLTKSLEKEFKQWALRNVLGPILSEQAPPASRDKSSKVFTRMEISDLRMMSSNGFVCYDKNNELQGRALFKMFYNYFNEKIPGNSSYYTNPMDEFVFDDISKIKISRFGLLVEDTESLIEGKKTFNVYFMDKNILYDTHGDVILSFLLLLIFANKHEGRCLGALSLRNLPFLAK